MVTVPILDFKTCQKRYRTWLDQVKPNDRISNVNFGMNICAGKKKKDSCQVRFRMYLFLTFPACF